MPRTKGAFIVRYELHSPDLVLQSALPTLPPADPTPTITERFSEYHEAHPEIYEHIMDLAWSDFYAGRLIRVKRYFERIRSEIPGGLDNSYSALYARLLDQMPDFHGRVAMRARRAE